MVRLSILSMNGFQHHLKLFPVVCLHEGGLKTGHCIGHCFTLAADECSRLNNLLEQVPFPSALAPVYSMVSWPEI